MTGKVRSFTDSMVLKLKHMHVLNGLRGNCVYQGGAREDIIFDLQLSKTYQKLDLNNVYVIGKSKFYNLFSDLSWTIREP